MKRPVTCRRCGKLIRQGQVMGVWILGNGVVKLQVRYQCPRCHHESYAILRSNRTTVGLKRSLGWLKISLGCTQQSHHCGLKL
ncbi:hypothetical protein, partial [Fervidibacter sacchari]